MALDVYVDGVASRDATGWRAADSDRRKLDSRGDSVCAPSKRLILWPMKPIVLLIMLVLAFASGFVVGERRMRRVHDEQVRVLRAQIQAWQAHDMGMPITSLMTAE